MEKQERSSKSEYKLKREEVETAHTKSMMAIHWQDKR